MASFAVVFGTRPEIIKLAGVLDTLGPAAVAIHTGQHYDEDLSQVFLRGLGLAPPRYQLHLGGLSRADQIGRGTAEVAALLEQIKPDAVIVQGDTNSALAGALAANSTGTPLVHVEAGLRSFDRAMPEEHNRVLIDHVADLLAAPTRGAVDNLLREGINREAIVCTGNTIVEAVWRQLPDREQRVAILARFQVRTRSFVLATIHRPENTDDPDVLRRILTELGSLGMKVLLPLHPRTVAAVQAANAADLLAPLTILSPLDGATFLGLAAEAAILVSDSGGVQEEATVLGKPLVVVRRSTERPEALVGFATLVAPTGLVRAARAYLSDLPGVYRSLEKLGSPFGDGTASATICREVIARFSPSDAVSAP